MAKISIPCLVGKTNKAGVTSWYWQPSATLRKAGFEPEKLGKDQGAAMRRADDLNAQVERWKGGADILDQIKPRTMPGTFTALIERYRKDKVNGIDPLTGERYIKQSTADTYEVQLKRLEIWAGKHPISYITPARVKALRNALVDPEDGIGHSAAHNTLKVLRQIFAFAESEDIIPKRSNPATEFGLGAPPSRKGVWEADDEAAFIKAAYHLNMPSMAFAMKLAIYSAQREADLINFTDTQLAQLEIHDLNVIARMGDKNGTVMGWDMAQGKSNGTTLMEIPFEPGILRETQNLLRTNRARDRAAVPPRLETYVLVDDETGLPWHLCQDGTVRTGSGPRRAFHKAWSSVAAKAAELTGRKHILKLVWHDLRRTRVVRLRRRGMSPDQIASITGHSPKSIEMMLKVYGPVDPTITAAAIASTLPVPVKKPAREAKKPSNKRQFKG
ncbi:hypothetical protein [Novosphingobium rosa]|uniref:hypothetical protein n=1 Tax=Novosphingobium rosa TaxID=76978 RepID=UPI0008378907|nr:hypothetical protein [Novosphingobium rosa]